MNKKRLIWQVYPSYLLLAVVSVVAVASYASFTMSKLHHAHTQDELTSVARLAAEHFREIVAARPTADAPGLPEPAVIDRECKAFGRNTGYRFTFILPSGKVIGDSLEDPAAMENHSDRTEIRDAFRAGLGVGTRFSHTHGMQMMYVAVPFVADGRTGGVVRTSLSLEAVDKALFRMWHRVAVAAILIACIAGLISFLVSRRIARPLEEIGVAADSIGRGDLRSRIRGSGVMEIDVLADTINRMAEQLNERINTVTQQRDEQSALLSCMIESVIAVDAGKRLIKMNSSAEALFHADDSSYGRNVAEIVGNADLVDFINRALESADPVEGRISLPAENIVLQAHGTVLNNAEGHRIGALIVLNDVTRLEQLERMRRDFVANVSHELRTPVTSIKGFVETLQDGAAKNPEDMARFLGILSKQADRLNSIINDLLSLSRIEHDFERNAIELAPGSVSSVIKDAVEVCLDRAEKKNISLKVSCAENLAAMINAPLLEQAVINLVDNAVKYSGENTSVEISASRENNRIVIRVADQGPGIEKEHLPRIFERFYRVDKGRSRALGGTGLGLAIVKHVALAHKGDVGVESKIGAGSCFSIHLLPVA